MARVKFESATRIYPGTVKPAIDGLDLEIHDGEFLVLVGPSGCGKSTALRMLAGLEDVTSGRVYIGDRDVTYLAPRDRDIAMVFQTYALYPHMTVAENMGFSLKIAGVHKSEIATRVAEAAKILDLADYLGRKPKQLSGGQRQRVAMGRAIVRQPQVFCMDEPLSNLDAKLRVSTRTQIASLQRRLDVTTVYVTHDQVEAMTMGDRVAVLKDGLLQQVDSPLNLYDHPVNMFVAEFIGSPGMNLGTFTVTDGTVGFGTARIPIPRGAASTLTADRIAMGFRPETLEFGSEGDPNSFAVRALVTEELGAEAFLYAELPEGSEGVLRSDHVVARIPSRSVPKKGDTVWLRMQEGTQHLFDADTGLRIPG
jgi:multiple sugar transport system ATP-binding protein